MWNHGFTQPYVYLDMYSLIWSGTEAKHETQLMNSERARLAAILQTSDIASDGQYLPY